MAETSHFQDPPSPSSLSNRVGRPSRNIVSQACDACRVRKTRCDIASNALRSPSSTSGDGNPSLSPDGVLRCQRCDNLNLSCTYLVPAGTRGPKRKNKTISNIRVSGTPVTIPRQESIPASGVSTLCRSPPDIHMHQPLHYPTDILCNRKLFHRMMAHYLEFLYPLIPVVHRPSFRKDLAHDRDLYDEDFLALVVALCAATVGTMPSRFREYCAAEPPVLFQTRTEMVNRCYEIISGLRGAKYFDEINHFKWAASYLMQISFFQVGQHNRARMVEVEALQLARLLDFHQISMYAGLNCIETQLRKKAFWLLFYGYVHSQLQNARRERLSYLDEIILASINLEDLIPFEVDDEMITEDSVSSHEVGWLSVTTGFNIHSRVFWAALKSRQTSPERCNCERSKDAALQLIHLQERLQDLKYMLDGIPTSLRQWTTSLDISETSHLTLEERRVLNGHFAIMRANLHVTHLWLQSIILDQIGALVSNETTDSTTSSPLSFSSYDPKTTWAEREDICRQLLHILHGISDPYIEPNGHHLTFKVRDVAVTLLACPFEEHDEVSRRAKQYLGEFTNKLSRLDGSETINTLSLQSWVDTDRRTSNSLGLTMW